VRRNLFPVPVNLTVSFSTLEDTTLSMQFNSDDPDSNPNVVNQGVSMHFTAVPTAAQGQLKNTADGTLISVGTFVAANCLFGTCTPFGITFVPFANFNSDLTAPISFSWLFDDAQSQTDETGVPVQTVFITVLGVNDAPTLVDNFVGSRPQRTIFMTYENNAGCTTGCIQPDPLIITFLALNDDAEPGSNLIAQLTVPKFCASLTLAPATAATMTTFVQNSVCQFTATGSLPALQNMFALDGIQFVAQRTPALTGDNTAVLTMFVNDQGNSPQGGLVLNVTKTANILLHKPGFGDGNPPPSTGVVGVFGLISFGMFVVYRVLRKKKIIPEEIDPWENDDMFDATVDNPLRLTSLE